jgi:UDP-2,3-diacylglucosamine pyrophosphatase LpxH
MTTSSRLTEVFEEARKNPIPFDDKSRFILFSDVHRGDNSWADEFARNQTLYFFALGHYFKKHFTYFELGDGDELYNNKLFSDIFEAHSHIFWQMKRFYDARPTRFYMLYGNHDIQRADPNTVAKTLRSAYYDQKLKREVPLFPDIRVYAGLVLKHTPTGGEIFLVHGHQGDLFNDRLWKIGCYLSRTLWRPLELLGFTQPISPARDNKKRVKIEKRIQAWIRNEDQPLISGHTHNPSFAQKGETPYFNTGSCIHPRGITGIEIENGNMVLIKWWIEPDRYGRLCVTREELDKPRTVASLFQ